jgi:acetyl-CoA carboxylase biotin carboxyl carrier protein
LPWFAAFFLRAFFLRDFFAMVSSYSCATSATDRTWRVVRSENPPRRGRDWIRFTDIIDEKGITMADEIRAEMVANVWKVVAAAGDTVAEGDTLVILESMKMEIPVLAESDGTLSQLAVNEGDVVQEGDLIAVIG